jgi:hypothetical protein
MAKQKTKRNVLSIEDQYSELFRYNPSTTAEIDGDSLEQPSPLKVVPSLTTYGAYEEPIVGA